MKVTLCVFLVAILGTAAPVHAQLEASHWYFGQQAGLHFGAASPTVLNDGLTATIEGTATVSDAWGNLLFYTDGRTVWNSHHSVMPDGLGLNGGASAAQAALIVHQPDSAHRYYVFTASHMASSPGLSYSIVDMQADGGLGDIVVKNMPLQFPVGEKITAYKHDNNRDIWIISHGWDNNEFQARLLTPAGLGAPVVSTVGSVHGGLVDNAIGFMKCSPDGKWLAAAVYKASVVELFRFDRSTGIVSAPLPLPQADWAYGLEFSPDSRKLYVSTQVTVPQVVQYDLTTDDSATIASSKLTVATTSVPQPGGLALAPNGKIYLAAWNGYCSVIANPNALGTACLYADNAVSLGAGLAKLSVPNFPPYLFAPNYLEHAGICSGDTTWLSVYDQYEVDSVHWWPGDGSGPLSAAGGTLGYIYPAPGTYAVEAIVYAPGPPDTLSADVTILDRPVLALPGDTILCPLPGGFWLVPGISGASSVVWHDGSTDTVYHVTAPGTVWVQAANACAVVRDSTDVSLSTLDVDLGDDRILCPQSSLELDPGLAGSDVLWNTGATSPTLLVTAPGLYAVTASEPGSACTGTDSVMVIASTLATVLPSVVVLSGGAAVLDAGNPTASHYWSTGESTQIITVTLPGTYEVTQVDAGGCLLVSTVVVTAPAGFDAVITGDIQLHPVPSEGPVQVQWTGSELLDGLLTVTASDGRRVWMERIRWSNGDGMVLQLGHLPAGAYWLRIEGQQGTGQKPFLLSGR